MTQEEKMKVLFEAVNLKETIKTTELELKEIRHQMRNLPIKKRKLDRMQEEISQKYNQIISKYNLPLKKI